MPTLKPKVGIFISLGIWVSLYYAHLVGAVFESRLVGCLWDGVRWPRMMKLERRWPASGLDELDELSTNHFTTGSETYSECAMWLKIKW